MSEQIDTEDRRVAQSCVTTSTTEYEAEQQRLAKRWPDPTPEQLGSPEFEVIWQTIKRWDINVPTVYNGYMGATGNHVRAILDALDRLKANK